MYQFENVKINLRKIFQLIFFITICSPIEINAQTDFALIQELNDHVQASGNTVLKDFYCQLLKEPNLTESITITLRRGQKYIFYFKGSKNNETQADIKIFAPNNKQSFSKASISNNEIGELRLLSSITQNFIIEISKPQAGKYNALVLMTLEGN